LCGFIGNAIFNYELTDEFITISDRNDPSSYYLGAPRLSVENYSKAGPGFVAEKVTITLQEFANNQPLESRILLDNMTESKGILTLMDPWSKRLSKYNNRVYYQGDKGYTVPDKPSLGDGRDAHLFVADELMPDYKQRYAFGQYAEFNKQVIERLDPRTNKIRITINIEAPNLGVMFRERGGNELPSVSSKLKLWEIVPWMSTWPSRSFGVKNNDGFPNENSPYNQLRNDTNIESTDVFQKIPQIGESRALISGLTFALIPIYRGREGVTNDDINSIFLQLEDFIEDVPSPIQTDLPPYNALQELEEKRAQEAQDAIPLPVPAKYIPPATMLGVGLQRIGESATIINFNVVTVGPPQPVTSAFTVTQGLVEAGRDVVLSVSIETYHNDRNNSLLYFGVYEFDEAGTFIQKIGNWIYPEGVNDNNKVTKKQNYTTAFTATIQSEKLVTGNYYQIVGIADVNRDGHNHTVQPSTSFMRVDFA
jgi:hypothetical protein